MANSENRTRTAILSGNLCFLLILTTPYLMFAQDDEPVPDVEAIVKKMDQLYRSETSHAEMEMQIATPHWERTLAMTVWTKGMDHTFIRITAPKKEQGVATLRIGNEMWNYLPKTNKVMKIPPSMMMGSWMGSDFTNDDLVKESSMLNDYTYQLVKPEDATPAKCTFSSSRKKILRLFGAKLLPPCGPAIIFRYGSISMTNKGT